MEMELSKIFVAETNRNGIPFSFPFADHTNGIPQDVLVP